MSIFSRKKKRNKAMFGPETFRPGGIGMTDKKKKKKQLPVKKPKRMTPTQAVTFIKATTGALPRGGFPPILMETREGISKSLGEKAKIENKELELTSENVMKKYNLTDAELRKRSTDMMGLQDSRMRVEEEIGLFKKSDQKTRANMIDITAHDLKHSMGRGTIPATKLNMMLKILEREERERNKDV